MMSETSDASRAQPISPPEPSRRVVSSADAETFERISERVSQRQARDDAGGGTRESPAHARAPGGPRLQHEAALQAGAAALVDGAGAVVGDEVPVGAIAEDTATPPSERSSDEAALQTLPTAAQLGMLPLGATPGYAAAPAGPIGAPDAGVTDQRAALAQLSACVERLLVEASPRGRQLPAATITLSPDLYVDTSLSLSRQEQGGWLLRISTRDERLLEDIDACKAALSERFAARGLGDVAVETD